MQRSGSEMTTRPNQFFAAWELSGRPKSGPGHRSNSWTDTYRTEGRVRTPGMKRRGHMGDTLSCFLLLLERYPVRPCSYDSL